MTTILAIFIIAFLLSLALTPLAGRLGTRFGAVDEPQGRKVHINPWHTQLNEDKIKDLREKRFYFKVGRQ
jgi:hypothetical protein